MNANLQWLSSARVANPASRLGQFGMLGQTSCSECGNDVCWWCWGKPNFETCKRQCENDPLNSSPQTVRDCICHSCVTDIYCGPPPAGAIPNAFPWRQYAPETCTLQSQINDLLLGNDYQQLTVDCKLGGRTCGAANYAHTFNPDSYPLPETCLAHRSEWIAPTKVGQAPPPAPDCRANPSLCSSTQSCDQSTGECFEDCRKPGATPCGPGTSCDQATGNCLAVPPKAAKKGPGAGVFVLGLAALLGIGFALTGRG